MNEEYQFNRIPHVVPTVYTKNRKICTELPVPESVEIINRHMKYEPWSMNNQLWIIWEKAVDYQIFDKWGNIWIDFTSGAFVTNAGHGNPMVIAALQEMIDKPMLYNYYYSLEKRSLLAEQLIHMAPEGMNKAFFLTTGAESTECALKLCRIHGQKVNQNKIGMISFDGAFHGKTLGAQTMTGKPKSQKWIGKMDQYIYHLPCPTDVFEGMNQIYDEEKGRSLFVRDIEELAASGVDLDTIAGAIMEPYQGWAALFYPIGYVKALREFLTAKDALLVSDEVQAGFGRTGRLFGYEHYGVKPDLICCGKGISGSLPLSAVIGREELLDVDGSLNSTHGGSPLPVAAALANLKYIENNQLVEESRRKEVILREKFEELQAAFPNRICSIHGKGMAFAAVIVKPNTKELDIKFVDRVIERAYEKGLCSVRTLTGTIKVAPPLTIPDDAIIEGMDILMESMQEIVEESEK